MTKKQKQDPDRAEAMRVLRKAFPPGATAYTILRHVSSSGMTRRISVVGISRWKRNSGVETGVACFDWHVAKVVGLKEHKDGGLVVGGCGMDMGFHVVYELSRALYPKGFRCAGLRKCRSNDHSNGDRDYTPHHHRDGGYALKQAWL